MDMTDTGSASSATDLGSGPDQITLQVSEDAYMGDAEFTVFVDGIQIGGTQTATALHSTDSDETFLLNGSFGSGSSSVAVDFLNDAYGGTPQTDRNLYVDQIDANGQVIIENEELYVNGPAYFYVPAGVACFCSETKILTDHGEVAVNALTIGDKVVTARNKIETIRWIGRRSYNKRSLAAAPAVYPIRFRAGALGNGLPRRDLLISPDHALFLDGLLIPSSCLVNDITIVQERGLDQVDYFHVELDSHNVLLAEGALAESFLDDDSRDMFHNANEFTPSYLDTQKRGGFYAPRVTSGYDLELVRQRLAMVARKFAEAA